MRPAAAASTGRRVLRPYGPPGGGVSVTSRSVSVRAERRQSSGTVVERRRLTPKCWHDRWCNHYLEDARARHCAHATAVPVARTACPTTKPWTRRSRNEVWRGGGLPPFSPLVASGCAQMCSPPASNSTWFGCVTAAGSGAVANAAVGLGLWGWVMGGGRGAESLLGTRFPWQCLCAARDQCFLQVRQY
jgi:hypothetical protein